MKRKQDIDELLNAYIDGELTVRQRTQLQRLLDKEPKLAGRIEKLRRTSELYNSMPISQAPPDLAENVARLLERQSLLEKTEPVERSRNRVGAVSLFTRKLVAAAAMIGLLAALAAVVYSIIASGPDATVPVADANRTTPGRLTQVASAMNFNGRLELKTANLEEIDAAITKAIAANSLIEHRVERLNGTNRYAVTCSHRGLDSLLKDLGPVWDQFSSATLFVETDAVAQPVVVANVAPAQISKIAGQETLEKSVQVAKQYAFLNDFGDPDGLTAHPSPDIIPIPKPHLTQDDPNEELGLENMNLTLVVISTE